MAVSNFGFEGPAGLGVIGFEGQALGSWYWLWPGYWVRLGLGLVIIGSCEEGLWVYDSIFGFW
jgi:hypothetical protein